jgi:hypothetical protein
LLPTVLPSELFRLLGESGNTPPKDLRRPNISI